MRVSVTDLEAFRRLQSEDWMTDAKFQAQLAREPFERTDKAALGQSLHAAIEAFVLSGGRLRITDSPFMDEVLASVVTDGALEVKSEKSFEVAGETVTVVGRADHLVDLGIVDHKFIWRQFDHDDYANSMQWRWYCVLFGARWVRYDVRVLSLTQEHGLRITDHQEPTFSAYPRMLRDCLDHLALFVGYIHERGLGDLVADRKGARS